MRKVAVVEWFDAEVLVREDVPHKCPLMRSVGFVEVLNDKILIVNLLPDNEDLTHGVVQILPKGMVKKIRWMYEKPKRNAKSTKNHRKGMEKKSAVKTHATTG